MNSKETLNDEKKLLRFKMCQLLRDRTAYDSTHHRQIILQSLAWQKARCVLLFSPLPLEPDLMKLLSERDGRSLIFPRIEGETIGLYLYHDEAQWIDGPFGLKEPDPQKWLRILPAEIDLALVPGLAFDWRGNRLGRGKGYYDRLLGSSDFHALKIGLCWKFQLLTRVPCGEHDIRMDAIIAGEKMINISLPM